MRIATFNLETLDDETGQDLSLATHVAIIRPNWSASLSTSCVCRRFTAGTVRRAAPWPPWTRCLPSTRVRTLRAAYHHYGQRPAVPGAQPRDLEPLSVHRQSKLATDITGQKLDDYTWKSPAAWAEGFFISSMKRVGQALQVRLELDRLFNEADQADSPAP